MTLLVALSTACGSGGQESAPNADGGAPADAGPDADARARIYVTLFTHNGPSAPSELAADTQANYLAYRKTLLDVAQLVIQKGAAWDYQVNWLGAVRHAQWETSDVIDGKTYGDTDGQNVIKYLATISPRVAVGMTSHEDTGLSMLDQASGSVPVDEATLSALGLSNVDGNTIWRYADIAHVLEFLGAPQQTHGVLGGALANYIDGTSTNYWQDYLKPVSGNVYKDSTFVPKVLAFVGTGGVGHTSETGSSGVWHPSAATKSLDSFFTDDPSQTTLINIGNFNTATAGSVAFLDKLLAMLEAGQLPGNRMYTATFFTNDMGTTSDKLLPAISALIDRYQPYVDSGDLVWSTVEGISDCWQNDYGRATSMWVDK